MRIPDDKELRISEQVTMVILLIGLIIMIGATT